MGSRFLCLALAVSAAAAAAPIAAPVLAGTLDPALEPFILANRDTVLSVSFFMASQFDLSQLHLEGLSREERRRLIIQALQNHARVTQEDILKSMRNPLPGEIITNIGSTWIVNAVDAEANIPAIVRLALRDDVDVTYLNQPGPPWPAPVGSATWGGIKAQFR